MSLTLTQKLLENTQKQYLILKRQSLQPVSSSKKHKLLTEEQSQSIHQNSFELSNEEQTNKMKISLNISKDIKKDKKSSSLIQKEDNHSKQNNNKDYFNFEQDNGQKKQRKSLGSLPSVRFSNRNQTQGDESSLKRIPLKSSESNKQGGYFKKQELNIVVWEQGQQKEDDHSQEYGLVSPSNSQISKEQKKSNTNIINSPVSTKNLIKPISKNPPRSSFLAQIPYYELKAQQKKETIQLKLKEKKQQYKNFLEQLDSRRQTFTKFSFKSYERDDNPFLNPLIQKVNNLELKGSMHVIDLWEDKALKKYLNYSKLRDGKYMLRGIAQQISSDLMQQKKDQPTIFTKKDENILQGRLQDKDQMTNYLKHINDEYKKNDKILDRQIQKSGLSQAISRQSIVIPAEANFQNVLTNKRQSSIISQAQETDQPFDDVQFIKNFFQKTQSLASLTPSPNTNFLSPNYVQTSQKENGSLTTTPQKQRKSQQNYFFPTSHQQNETSDNLKNVFTQTQDKITESNRKKQQFLSIPTSVTESSPQLDKYSKNGLFSTEPQSKGFNLNYDDKQLSMFNSQNKLAYSSELNSTNYFNAKTRSDWSKSILFTPKNEKNNNKQQQISVNHSKQSYPQLTQTLFLGKQLKNVHHNRSVQNHFKSHLDEINSEMKTSLNTSRDLGTSQSRQIRKVKESQQNLAKINHMFREIDDMQQSDLNQKKKIDELIEKIQDRVIVSIQNQKKKIIDDDRMNNLGRTIQE